MTDTATRPAVHLHIAGERMNKGSGGFGVAERELPRCSSPRRRRHHEDISDAVAFLVSDQAKWIPGVALPVDAGFCVR